MAVEYLHLNPVDEQLCWAFYEEVYREEFPTQHAEHPAIWLPLMRDDIAENRPRVHIILACQATRILGGLVLEHYRQTHCWLAAYMVVRSSARRQGIARGLLAEAEHLIQSSGPFPVLFAEAENSKQRLPILDKLGFRLLPVPYVQPALAPEKPVAHDLLLMVHQQQAVSPTRLRAFLTEFYASLRQSDSPHLAAMDSMLAGCDAQLWTRALV